MGIPNTFLSLVNQESAMSSRRKLHLMISDGFSEEELIRTLWFQDHCWQGTMQKNLHNSREIFQHWGSLGFHILSPSCAYIICLCAHTQACCLCHTTSHLWVKRAICIILEIMPGARGHFRDSRKVKQLCPRRIIVYHLLLLCRLPPTRSLLLSHNVLLKGGHFHHCAYLYFYANVTLTINLTN